MDEIGTTVLVASILDDGQLFHENRTPKDEPDAWSRRERGEEGDEPSISNGSSRRLKGCVWVGKRTDRPFLLVRQSP
jgi:hypothetical protein